MSIVSELPAEEAEKYFSQFRRRSTPEIAAINLRANGLLFEAWGGDALFSTGAELRYEEQFIDSQWDYGEYASLPFSGTRASSSTETSRRAIAVYAESTLPIVGERNRRPGIHALDLSAAFRYETYDDFGSATPPMVAIRYAPLRDVIFRASWSRGFQPPRQNQLFDPKNFIGPLTSVLFVDPLRPGLPLEPYFLVSGGNPNLEAETSDSYDFGIVIQPRGIPNLSLSANYFHYDRNNLVRTVNRQDAIDFPDLFPGRITRAEPTAEDIAAGIPGAIIELDTSFTNISEQIVNGWDFIITYRLRTDDLGSFTLRSDATYTKSYRERLRPGLDFVESVGDIGFSSSVPLEWRGKASVQWEINNWSTTFTARYVDSYVGRTNNPTPEVPSRLGLDGDKIPSSVEYDLQLSYRLGSSNGGRGLFSWLDDSRITLSILNIADSAPPLRTERNNQWYSLFNDPRQRYISISIRKQL
jgi:iron complex outermembrane recepter protein